MLGDTLGLKDGLAVEGRLGLTVIGAGVLGDKLVLAVVGLTDVGEDVVEVLLGSVVELTDVGVDALGVVLSAVVGLTDVG